MLQQYDSVWVVGNPCVLRGDKIPDGFSPSRVPTPCRLLAATGARFLRAADFNPLGAGAVETTASKDGAQTIDLTNHA